ncbi:hypothetical protein AZE42_08739 [Rhizopogon vesiculosus]|uniref:F-box domain-containing protein n=1 Tax=Rhizopogon vesiculosus TaxID=180088 RepID=A0A1J8QFC3_9AGAM|nr:hypothetical protein AZE42_08739 [Rhizopogon vesiculosus]
MQYYAKRVYSLRVSDEEEVAIDNDILHVLATSPFAPPLFTSLKRLSWSNNSINALPVLCSLVNSRLESLNLDLMDPMLFRHIVPYIRSDGNSFRIARFPADHSMRNLPPDVFQGWNNLQILYCGLVTDAALYHLATSAKLTCLSIRVDEENDYSTLIKFTGQSVFTALQELSLAATHTSYCIPILEIAELPSLRSIYIRSTETGLAAVELHHCFSLILRHCPSLRELHVEEWQVSPPKFPAGYTITFDILKTLFSLHHLEQLHLDTTCTFSLDDTELAKLADAWLKLHSLDLGTQNGWRQPSRITLHGLTELLLRCPVLSVVGLAMNAWAPEIDCRRPGKGVRRNSLEVLRVADSKIKDPFAVAAFLSDVAPNAEITGYDFAYDIDGMFDTRMMKYHERWEEVAKLHPMLVNLRKQEAGDLDESFGD